MSPSSGARFRTRFWVEVVLASVSGLMFLVTLVWHDWLEAFGFDPDHGDGSAEWLIVGALLAVALVLGVVARLEWRRAVTAAPAA